jgi:hypothetical protein
MGDGGGTYVHIELPMGAVAPSGQGAQDIDPGSRAKVPEGHSMHRVLRVDAKAAAAAHMQSPKSELR